MLARSLIALISLIALAGCGRGSEDFTVPVARPVNVVASAFGNKALDGDITPLFPGLKVVRTEPAPNAVLYTFPGDGSFPAAIRFTFEPAPDGEGTVIHTAIDVPSTTVVLAGKEMVISESKVEAMVRGILRAAASKMEEGRDTETEQRDFARMMTVLAIATDSKQLRLARDISNYPEWYLAGLGWLTGGGDGPANPYGDPTEGEDLGMAAAREERRMQRAENEEQAEAAQNARPMDEAVGESAAGEPAGGSFD